MGALFVSPRMRGVEKSAPPMGAQMEMHADEQVLHRGDVPEQPDILIGAADADGGDPVGRQPVDALAAKPDLAGGDLQILHDAVEDGGLAGTVRADDAVDRAL